MYVITGDSLVKIEHELSLSTLAAAIEECRDNNLSKPEQDKLIAEYINRPVSTTKSILKQLEQAGVIHYEHRQSGKMICMPCGATKFNDYLFEHELNGAIERRYFMVSGKESDLTAGAMLRAIDLSTGNPGREAERETRIGNEIISILHKETGTPCNKTELTALVKQTHPDSSRNIVSRILDKMVRMNLLEVKKTPGGCGGGSAYRLMPYVTVGDYRVVA